MQRQPLPRQVDARKLTSADARVSGSQPVSEFPRFVAGLCDDSGEVEADLHFFRDESAIHRVSASLQARVSVRCQRCLRAMPLTISSGFELGLVWTDAQARALPRELDSLVLGEEPLELLPLIEDELIIGTPYVNFHPVGACEPEGPVVYGEPETIADERENPFAALKDLKASD